jgi:hypothetical protein
VGDTAETAAPCRDIAGLHAEQKGHWTEWSLGVVGCSQVDALQEVLVLLRDLKDKQLLVNSHHAQQLHMARAGRLSQPGCAKQ